MDFTILITVYNKQHQKREKNKSIPWQLFGMNFYEVWRNSTLNITASGKAYKIVLGNFLFDLQNRESFEIVILFFLVDFVKQKNW